MWVPVLVLLAAAPAAAWQKSDKDARPNDPSACKYCLNDPAIMEKAGIVSHGGFEFGRTDTAAVDTLLATCDIRWIETPHFEIGFALGPMKVGLDEKEKVRGEMARLAEFLVDVPPKPTSLDPWLRAHVYAMRCEDLWKKMLELLQVKESDFPDGTRQWDTTGQYMGEGPYLGQKGKYELLMVPSESASVAFLKEHFGLVTKLTQRYHTIERDSLILVIHAQQEGVRVDEAFHAHITFNLSQNMLDGYKHYSYNLPIWIREGVSHYMERRVSEKYNSFDGSEGATAQMTKKSDWQQPTLKLVRSGEAPRMAELVAMKDFAELTLDRHFVTWSMIDFLATAHPDFLAKLLGGLKGIVNTQGVSDGSRLEAVHRDLFKRELGLSYAQFDAAWAAWVEATYGAQ